MLTSQMLRICILRLIMKYKTQSVRNVSTFRYAGDRAVKKD